MLVGDFDYDLPPELVAQEPAEVRDGSRLMVLDRKTGALAHRMFRELPELLLPGDALVVNDTRVYPARFDGVKSATGGRVEALILKGLGGSRYETLVRGAPAEGAHLTFGDGLGAVVESDLGGGKRVIRFDSAGPLDEKLDRLGRMPLPPYIDQGARAEDEDRERYQTVYAAKRGAVAAPTAGLHFTPGLLGRIRDMGVAVVSVTLHVGIGTFMPVRVERVEEHVMELEEYEVSAEAAEAINSARSGGGRVVAVGTTSARTLESAAGPDGRVEAGCSKTGLFIYPGYRFKAVDALVTNFHLPKSTLLMLVSAFAGRQAVLDSYKEAAHRHYRFYSYGDAMFLY